MDLKPFADRGRLLALEFGYGVLWLALSWRLMLFAAHSARAWWLKTQCSELPPRQPSFLRSNRRRHW